MKVLQDADAAAVVSVRRKHYEYVAGELRDTRGFTSLIPELPDGTCPLAFPFVVADRAYWCASLESRGISIQGWPGYYPGFDWQAYPRACDLKNNLVTLPVHHYLNASHMRYVVRCVREVAARARADGRC